MSIKSIKKTISYISLCVKGFKSQKQFKENLIDFFVKFSIKSSIIIFIVSFFSLAIVGTMDPSNNSDSAVLIKLISGLVLFNLMNISISIIHYVLFRMKILIYLYMVALIFPFYATGKTMISWYNEGFREAIDTFSSNLLYMLAPFAVFTAWGILGLILIMVVGLYKKINNTKTNIKKAIQASYEAGYNQMSGHEKMQMHAKNNQKKKDKDLKFIQEY